MGDDTELIAAQTVEEIAKRHNFPQKAINQIKTALVEACINAVEHSLSPDRKIYQKFAVESDRIDITVSNRGLRLADAKVTHAAPTGGRRGWGLTLMKGLMDEVTVERVDDGTRIRMTKFLKTHEK
jgi:serine/threonine-protein kinase RsbW